MGRVIIPEETEEQTNSTPEAAASYLRGEPKRFVGRTIAPCAPTRDGGCR